MVSPLNGEVFIRDGVVFFKGEGLESQVVAAEHLFKVRALVDDHHEWRLFLKDGSEVQWTMEMRKYGMQHLAETLQNMPSERPKPESEFHFGLSALDVQEKLDELTQGIATGDIIPQKLLTSVERAHDFEFKTVTITYAEKKQ